MNKLSPKQIQSFCDAHSLTPDALLPPFVRALELIHFSELAVIEETQRTQPKRPTWGLLWRMLSRCTEHAHAAIVTWATGYPAQAETLSRVVLEHAVTIIYVLRDESDERLVQYLFDFLKKEERNIAQLKTAFPELAADLAQRTTGLEIRRKVVSDLMLELGVVLPSSEWPNFMARCKGLGFEGDYRLYYYQLSSQLHADPEDLINELIASNSRSIERLAVETVAFSWMLTKAALGFYLRGLAEFSTRTCAGTAAAAVDCAAAELRSLEIVGVA